MKNLDKYLTLLGNQADALLLTSRYSRHYCGEFDIAEGIALVAREGCFYFTDSRYIESARNNLKGFDVVEMNRTHSYSKLINDTIARFGIETMGYEEDYLTVAELCSFEKELYAKLIPMGSQINSFREVKETWELDRIRKAQDITDRAFAEVLTRIKAGMTEKQLQAELIYCLYKNGSEGLAFDPIVVSGPNTSLPHGVAGERLIREGDFVTMDFGAMVGGYCSDMTRTVAVGYATDEMRRVYDTVLAAQKAGIAASKAGVTGRQIDSAARQVIADAGYGEYFGHGYGHCIGMQCHELPSCSPSGTKTMKVNMVSSAEPGIYLPGKFGVRIEDLVIFTADGCENITNSPKNLMIV